MVLRYKDIHAFDIADITKIINSMYREGEVSVRFIQPIDQQILPHVVREW